MQPSQQDLEQIVDLAARSVRTLVKPAADAAAPIERLFGEQGEFDSLGLVQVILEVEDRVEERYGVRLTIASEKAMSRGASPFRTVRSLAEFCLELLVAEGRDV
jgi:acyl carrier protein